VSFLLFPILSKVVIFRVSESEQHVLTKRTTFLGKTRARAKSAKKVLLLASSPPDEKKKMRVPQQRPPRQQQSSAARLIVGLRRDENNNDDADNDDVNDATVATNTSNALRGNDALSKGAVVRAASSLATTTITTTTTTPATTTTTVTTEKAKAKAINSELIKNAPSTRKEKEAKIPINKPAKHSSRFEKLDETSCAFAEDGTCGKAAKCNKLGVPVVYTRRLSYRVPENHPKFAGRRCCGTCYYRCTAVGETCAFVSDGSCAVANRREKDGMKVAFNYLKYRVPSNHEKYAGKWCCNSCYYKIQAKGKLCVFAKDGTCLIAKEKEEKGLILEYSNLPQRVPKTHPKYAGERCCETCANRCRVEGRICAFLASGECVYAKKLGVTAGDGNANKNKNNGKNSNNKRTRGENQNGQQQEQQQPDVEYKRFHRIPEDHPKYPGGVCCNACYIASKAEGQKCAFMDEGKCSYARNMLRNGAKEVTYKNLTYRVPASHDTHAGERCCRTCYRKCSEHAKEVRWATVLSNLLEKN
jgi:hypothetical protein